ncbi:MAG: hypothetical protein NT068_00370 [Candidatus Nomurabacteria bacterium]|nr:hypothetical protein [Candidatus Nomurabacteria bacterium]
MNRIFLPPLRQGEGWGGVGCKFNHPLSFSPLAKREKKYKIKFVLK